jgi:hypothetical protein
VGRKRRASAPDPVSEFEEQAKWSSYTNSWSRSFRGWRWPVRAPILVIALACGAVAGLILWLATVFLTRLI